MKNKEIEELLNELKEVTNSKKLSSTYCITNKHWQLLLSYIETIENRNKELYEGFMATQEELTDYAMKNEQLENLCNKYEQEHKTTFEIWKKDIKKLKQLENNRDKAIEYVEKHTDKLKNIIVPKRDFDYKELLNKLKGGSDE